MTFFEDMKSAMLEAVEFEERKMSSKEIEELMEAIEKDPNIKNAKVPEGLREDVFKSIREYDERKAGCERFWNFIKMSDEEFEKFLKNSAEKDD